jgi:hypothetical protein
MSYQEVGYQFLNYFVDCINLNHENLLVHLNQDSMLTINTEEALGPDSFMQYFNLIKLHNLKLETKFALIQPIYWKNPTKNNFDGILILASGSVNVIENGIYVNKNVHFNIMIENIMGHYYISNLIIRLSERSRQIQNNNQVTFNTRPMWNNQQHGQHNQQYNQQYNQQHNQQYNGNPFNNSYNMDLH